ncbi:unnamed protein product [Bemisia tabaci]|uniref:peptidylglycine monooxygenase n=1 Tax=Bemisia tabaci TaxID=7038 RepID=A0A9P0EVX2_BEMTA|nr:PREDICTED: peptidylglycine alpha-hydroxylating monooxygenase [Bemisia tabaci]CAH0381348.1 unnamed protein product [Bemisia tabaci]
MVIKYSYFLFVILAFASRNTCSAIVIKKFPFLMPNIHPFIDDLYICTAVRIDYSKPYHIVAFEPNATMHTAHHILLYGCKEPSTTLSVWNCGEMSSTLDGLPAFNPCKSGSEIIYAWARDAPPFNLPEGVGFLVGGDSPIQYLILQVHYAHKYKDGESDRSGLILHYTEEPLPRTAAVILLGTGGQIHPKRIEHMEASCNIEEHKVLHPVAYRTHTHQLGKVVSGYVIREENGKQVWTLLGKRDPLTPQMFYPVETPDNFTIRYGDKLAARCTMKNTRDKIVEVGQTSMDEMCNFYLTYWVEKTSPLEQKYCFTNGPPAYHWGEDDGIDVNRIPESASSLN